ncbi:hypothetical protein AMS68_003073 [Peltaster fructicola]|uniref:BHLH domain-containing protein n=1 Tax=Peltaster fructicola TaxID=286661 RepID=A0A6H0XS89_9PEZI|nr:hypothetical protein AMS68_003073 [Peltaster fructicola]
MNAATAEQRAWSQPDESVDPMAHMSGDLDDLSNIFSINDFDLEAMQNVNGQQYVEAMHTTHAEPHPTTPYLENIPQAPHGTATHDFGGDHTAFGLGTDVDTQQQQSQQPQHFDAHDEQHGANLYAGNAIYHAQIPQHYSQHVHQSPFPVGVQHYTTGGQIPPTPNSYEMHGEAGRFLQQHSQTLFEHQKHMRKLEHQRQIHQQHAQFTPMASPDGTPQYAIQSEFTTPGAYFSPLTSPALHAQLPPANSRSLIQQAQGYFTNPSTAPSSNAPSPVDLNNDIEMTDGVVADSNNKRARRKMVTPRSVGPIGSRPRQSPIQKPQKRKSGLLTSIIPPKELDKMMAEGPGQAPASAVSHISQTFDSSESGSISPEPLSESLMGPPPRPSPSINPQLQKPLNKNMDAFNKAAAATPKSILSMRSNQHYDASKRSPRLSGQASFEELQLPEAANKQPPRPSLTKIDIMAAERSNARKTLSLVLPARPRPYVQTRHLPALLRDKKADGKSRTAKKRSSISTTASALASPALRPRISPSIKPLLPEGSTLHSPTHALLLASKSNYQNLLEGNHLPGVSYPDSLSTGLTSKRTSHKVAEQGRRNRINEALKEMQALIPSPSLLAKQQSGDDAGSKDEEGSADADDCKDSKESVAAKSNSSKAATVESANRYIRLLKESDASQKAAILALKKENEAIRRRLAHATGAPDSEMTSIEEIDMQTSDDSSD